MAQRGRNKLSRLRRRGEFGRRVKPLQLGPNQTGGSSDLVSPIYHANFSSFFTIQPTGRGTYIEVAIPSLESEKSLEICFIHTLRSFVRVSTLLIQPRFEQEFLSPRAEVVGFLDSFATGRERKGERWIARKKEGEESIMSGFGFGIGKKVVGNERGYGREIISA